jgi:uncharacterized protein
MPNTPKSIAGCQKGFDAAKQGDFATALREFKSLADQGDAFAQFYMGELYLNGLGVSRNFDTATEWFAIAAEQGNSKAQQNMKIISSPCKNGFFAAKQGDFATALREFKSLADRGDALAQYYMGDLYLNGLGVSQDTKVATKWFTLSAEQGNADAQNNLAAISSERLFGRGYKDAVKWYTLAAEQGNAPAQLGLGAMYDNGWGVSRDPNIAIKWYTLAAEQGHAPAQFNLGAMSMLGKGTPMDFTIARMWYLIAAAQGHEQAKNGLEQYKDGLSPTEIETAETLANEWLEKH